MSVLSLRYLFVSMRIVALLLRGAITQLPVLQSLQERRSLRVPLVGRNPRERDAVTKGAIDLLERDQMFRTVEDIVGNARFPPTLWIGPTMLG